MLKILVCIFSYVILGAVAIRDFVAVPGTLGHNWDWFIPANTLYLQNIAKSVFFTWRNFSFGEPISLWLPAAPFFGLLTSFSFLGAGSDLLSKSLIFSTIVIAAVGMFLFANYLHSKAATCFSAFLAGLFYGFSPFLLSEFIGGAATQFFAYALLPWFFFFFYMFTQKEKNRLRNLFFSVCFLGAISISLHFLIIALAMAVAYLFVVNNKTYYLKNLFLVVFLYLLANAYWILPTMIELAHIKATLDNGASFSYNTISNLVPSLTEALLSIGYARPFYSSIISENLLPYWFAFVYLGFSIFLFKLTLKLKKESLFWLFVYIISLVFVTGGKEPLGNFVIFLYQNFPLMSLFRSPQHFIVIPTFATAILISFGTMGKSKLNKIFSLAVVFVWLCPFIIMGDLGSKILQSKQMEYIDNYSLPSDYNQVIDFLYQDKEDYKVLFLPLSGSPLYLKTDYQNKNQGGDPLLEYSLKDTITTDISYGSQARQIILDLESLFCHAEYNKNLPQILGLLNIKYLILRNDVKPHFSDCRTWDSSIVNNYLGKYNDFEKIIEGKNIVIYQNKKLAPHFYGIKREKWLTFSKSGLSQVNQDIQISSEKINPTRYRLKIKSSEGPFMLAFIESFNDYWLIKINSGPQSSINQTKINDFANGWTIDQPGDYELELNYKPQKFLQMGMIISAAAYMILLLLIVKSKTKKK